QTFSFVDEANDNYRLTPNDTGARNRGTDLSDDSDYAFSVDIIGTARPQGGTWDIGAFELRAPKYKMQGKIRFEGDVRFE
ncbi:MAG: choice-of-anchor Q domain-containing protein, partial [Patescibacteria group bacterium]